VPAPVRRGADLVKVVREHPAFQLAEELHADAVALLLRTHAESLEAQCRLGAAELAGHAAREHVTGKLAVPPRRELNVILRRLQRGAPAHLEIGAPLAAEDRGVDRDDVVEVRGPEPAQLEVRHPASRRAFLGHGFLHGRPSIVSPPA
jgi:hypothetical protein